MAKKIVTKIEENPVEVPQDEVVQETAIVEEVKPVMKVGQRARQLILMNELSNAEILEQIKKEYPAAKTSIACIAWYKSDLKKSKPVDGYTAWLKANEMELRAKYESTLVGEAV